MKQLLIATAALSLLGGAAFAQAPSPNNPTNNPISDSTAKPGVTEGGAVAAGNPATPADGSPATSPMPAPASTVASPPPADPSTTSVASAPAADTTSTTMATNSVGAAPATYPVCTSKHEDRCVNRYQATRMAKMATRHQKTDNVQPSGM